MKKRLLSLFCAFAMIMSIMPMALVSAEETAKTPLYAVSGNRAVSGNYNMQAIFPNTDTLAIQPRFTERNSRATYSYLDGSTNTGDMACTMKQSMGNLWGDGSQGNYVKGDTQITLWDLGDVYQIDRVDVLSVKGNALTSMTVSVSTDGTNYTPYSNLVSEHSTALSGENVYVNAVTFPAPVKARYVKVDARMSANGGGLMSNVFIWSGLERISEMWNTYHDFSYLLDQGGYTEETANALTTALANAKAAAEGETALTDEILATNIGAMNSAARSLVKEAHVPMHVLSGNALNQDSLNAYKNILGEEITVNETGATYEITAGSSNANAESIQGGDLTNFNTKPWSSNHDITVVYDLKDSYKINRVDIWGRYDWNEYFCYKGVKNVKVEVSADNETFTPVTSTLNTVHGLANMIDYTTASFDYVDARYVKVTVSDDESQYAWPFGNILVMTGSDKTEFKNQIAKANELLKETTKYSAESLENLQNAVTTANSSVEADFTQANIDAQTANVKAAIIALNYSDTYCVKKTVVSGNDLNTRNGEGVTRYHNKIGYDLVDGKTGATYVWEDNAGKNNTDPDATKLTQTGMFAFEGSPTEANNGWGTDGGWKTTIRFDLKDTYSINEVDIVSRHTEWYHGYGSAEIQVSTDDADDTQEGVEKVWTTVATMDFDNAVIPWVEGNGGFQQIKFTATDAKYVRVITDTTKPEGGQYYQTCLSSILILSDDTVVSSEVKKAFNEAVAMAENLMGTAKYTDETTDALDDVVTAAKAAVAANPTQEVYEAQTKAINDAIVALDYAEASISKRYVLSGNDWTNGGKSTGDHAWYKNKAGYEIVDSGNKPTYRWSNPEKMANSDITNKGLFAFWDGDCAVWDNTSQKEIYIQYDLKDTYNLDQIDVFTHNAGQSYQKFRDVTIQVSTDDADDTQEGVEKQWTTVVTAQPYNTTAVLGHSNVYRHILDLGGKDARYVRITFNKDATNNQILFKSIVIMSKTNTFLKGWNTFIASAEAMLTDVKYTQASRDALKVVIDDAKAAVENDPDVISEQESIVKTAIGRLLYDSAYWQKKTLVSDNLFVNGDYEWYQNNVGYDLVKYSTGATSAWTDDSCGSLAGQSSDIVMAGGINDVFNKPCAIPNSVPSATTSTFAIDLKNTYAIEEVDVLSRAKQNWAPGINRVKVKVSTDNKNWEEVANQEFDNELFRSMPQVGFNQVKFNKKEARYVRVEFEHNTNFAIRAIMVLAGDDVAYSTTLANAKSMLTETATYTAESLAELQAAITAAEEAVAADSSSAVKDEHTSLLQKAINNVYYKPIYNKRILSGNNWNDEDKALYEKWFGYRTTIVGNSASYTYDNPEGYACETDTENNAQELKGPYITQQNSSHASNTSWSNGGTHEEAITYDLKGVYEVNEVHLATSIDSLKYHNTLKLEYQPADSDDYVEIGTFKFDRKTYRNQETLAIHAVKFDTVEARKIRLTVSYSSYQVVFQNIVILGDEKDLSISATNVTYTDADANDVNSLEGITDLYIEGQIYNETDETVTGLTAFTAIYRGGALVDVQQSEVFDIEATGTKTADLYFEFTDLTGMTGNEEVKTFVWQNATNDMKPILKTVIEYGK